MKATLRRVVPQPEGSTTITPVTEVPVGAKTAIVTEVVEKTPAQLKREALLAQMAELEKAEADEAAALAAKLAADKEVERQKRESDEAAAEVKEQEAPGNAGFASELLGEVEENPEGAAETPEGPGNRAPAIIHKPTNYEEASYGAFTGDFDPSFLRLPRLQVVNGNGKMSELYSQGDVIFADELLFHTPQKATDRYGKFRFIPAMVNLQWRQNLTKEEATSGMMPITVDHKSEAEELGGATQWIGNERPRWSPSAKCYFLLEMPAGSEQHPGFSVALGDKAFGACVFYASGGSFSGTAQQIFNTAQWGLRDDADKTKILLWKKYWTMDFGKVKAGEFMVFRPSVRVTTTLVEPDVREICAAIAGVKPEQVEDDE